MSRGDRQSDAADRDKRCFQTSLISPWAIKKIGLPKPSTNIDCDDPLVASLILRVQFFFSFFFLFFNPEISR